ncbi:MAG: hypothetical protein ACE5JP_16670 [Candidatus Bipolaricaulia bacterium]
MQSDETIYGPREKRRPDIFEDQELGCTVRIDSWIRRKKEPGKKWEVHDFGINLSYKVAEDAPENEFQDVVRYDCRHYHAEMHKFWISPVPIELKWAVGKQLDEIFEVCKQDIKENYRSYIKHMQAVDRD